MSALPADITPQADPLATSLPDGLHVVTSINPSLTAMVLADASAVDNGWKKAREGAGATVAEVDGADVHTRHRLVVSARSRFAKTAAVTATATGVRVVFDSQTARPELLVSQMIQDMRSPEINIKGAVRYRTEHSSIHRCVAASEGAETTHSGAVMLGALNGAALPGGVAYTVLADVKGGKVIGYYLRLG